MELEEYKRYLAGRIEREVLRFLIPQPKPHQLQKTPPPHPIPPPMEEELDKCLTREEAKRKVLEVLNYIIENKKATEKELQARLTPPVYVVSPEELHDLEDRYIEVLKEWAQEKRKELEALQSGSEQVGRTQEEFARGREPRLDFYRMNALRRLGPLAFILPPLVLTVLEKHNLYNEPEVFKKLLELHTELLKPPFFLDGKWYVESLPEWYIKVLYESHKKKSERTS